MDLFPQDWVALFALETPLFELLVRGSLLYVGILVLMRFMPRRTGNELAVMDLIFLLLITEVASHSLGEYTSLGDGLVLVVVLMLWDYLINILSYHVPFIERLLSSPPLQIVKDGELLRRNMRREFLTEDELMCYLRESGIDRLEEVKAAYIEGKGKITILKVRTGSGEA